MTTMDWRKIWNKLKTHWHYVHASHVPYSRKFGEKVLSHPNFARKLNQHLRNNPGEPIFKLKNDETGETFTFRKTGYLTNEEIKKETRKKKLKKIDKHLK